MVDFNKKGQQQFSFRNSVSVRYAREFIANNNRANCSANVKNVAQAGTTVGFDYNELNELFLEKGLDALYEKLQKLEESGVVENLEKKDNPETLKTIVSCEYQGTKYSFEGDMQSVVRAESPNNFRVGDIGGQCTCPAPLDNAASASECDIVSLSLKPEDIDKSVDTYMQSKYKTLLGNVLDTPTLDAIKSIVSSYISDLGEDATIEQFKNILDLSVEIAQMAASKGVDKAEYVSIRLLDFAAIREVEPNMTLEEMNTALAKSDYLESMVTKIDAELQIALGRNEDLDEFSLEEKADIAAVLCDFDESARLGFYNAKTAIYLSLAESGELTAEEYYERIKSDLADTFPGYVNMSDDEIYHLRKWIDSLSPEEVQNIQNMIMLLPANYNDNYESALQEFYSRISDITLDEDGKFRLRDTVREYSLANGSRKLSFEEIFESRYGTKFDADKVIECNNLEAQLQMKMMTDMYASSLIDILENAHTDEEIQNAIGQVLLLSCGSYDETKMTEILQQLTGMSNVEFRDCQVVINQTFNAPGNGQQSGNNTARIISDVRNAVSSGIKAVTNEGKDLQQLVSEYTTLQTDTYGEKQTSWYENAKTSVDLFIANDLVSTIGAFAEEHPDLVNVVETTACIIGAVGTAVAVFATAPAWVTGGTIAAVGAGVVAAASSAAEVLGNLKTALDAGVAELYDELGNFKPNELAQRMINKAETETALAGLSIVTGFVGNMASKALFIKTELCKTPGLITSAFANCFSAAMDIIASSLLTGESRISSNLTSAAIATAIETGIFRGKSIVRAGEKAYSKIVKHEIKVDFADGTKGSLPAFYFDDLDNAKGVIEKYYKKEVDKISYEKHTEFKKVVKNIKEDIKKRTATFDTDWTSYDEFGSWNCKAQTKFLSRNEYIGKNEKILDGLEMGWSGGKETTVVDRANDANLRAIIDEVKNATNEMTDKEKSKYLFDYIVNKCKGVDGDNEKLSGNVLIGDLFVNEPGSTVCRHRALLYKVLSDEIGLKSDLIAVCTTYSGSSDHVIARTYFEDGTSDFIDSMWDRITSDTYANLSTRYKSFDGKALSSKTKMQKIVTTSLAIARGVGTLCADDNVGGTNGNPPDPWNSSNSSGNGTDPTAPWNSSNSSGDGTGSGNGPKGTNGGNETNGNNGTGGSGYGNGNDGATVTGDHGNNNGDNGNNGGNGNNGSNGNNGGNGNNGNNGTNGSNGTNSGNGNNGVNGTDGIDGTDGTDGSNGTDGANGNNGNGDGSGNPTVIASGTLPGTVDIYSGWDGTLNPAGDGNYSSGAGNGTHTVTFDDVADYLRSIYGYDVNIDITKS